jgi:hypothetical protein
LICRFPHVEEVALPADADLILLSRDLSPPREDVWRSALAQQGVRLKVHRLAGTRRPEDSNRWATIARARNKGKRLGTAPWAMFLDDDVVLGPTCVARLLEGLKGRPGFAALAADYAGDMSQGWGHWDYPRHVGMGATLFRRERLEEVTFRWEPERCECQCCCDDLRRRGFGIGYLMGADAWHKPSAEQRAACLTDVHPGPSEAPGLDGGPNLPGRILAAFDRRHVRLFRRRFLASLRGSGNAEQVTAVGYGLFRSERSVLARSTTGVEVVSAPNDGHPAVRKLRDFQGVVARWPKETPVAYWDAGDVVFQGRLGPLWDLVRTYPDQLLATREQVPFLPNPGVRRWVESIWDPDARKRAMDLFTDRPVLNGGFAAGTARVMLRYLREAERLRDSTALRGSSDWGDQTVLNLYCRSNPQAWREIATGWNFCLVGLGPKDYRVHPNGRTERLDGEPLHVVHGNNGTLKAWNLVHLTA